MEALQLRTHRKLTVPRSRFLFISARSRESICKQFPVTDAEGKIAVRKCDIRLIPRGRSQIGLFVTKTPIYSFNRSDLELGISMYINKYT